MSIAVVNNILLRIRHDAQCSVTGEIQVILRNEPIALLQKASYSID